MKVKWFRTSMRVNIRSEYGSSFFLKTYTLKNKQKHIENKFVIQKIILFL